MSIGLPVYRSIDSLLSFCIVKLTLTLNDGFNCIKISFALGRHTFVGNIKAFSFQGRNIEIFFKKKTLGEKTLQKL